MIDTIPVYPLGHWIKNDYRRYETQPIPRQIKHKKPAMPKAPVVKLDMREAGEMLDLFELCNHFGSRPREALERVRSLGWRSTFEDRIDSRGKRWCVVQVWEVQA
jgi:hypothetical protein